VREILFRGKRLDNGEWIQGDIVQFPVHGIVRIVEQEPSYKDAEVDSDTVGQYTGLTDKNSNEIFEGDIVKTSHGGSTYYAKIEWDDGSFWVTNHDIQMPSYISEVSKTYLEIIGNIYDNPELVGGESDG
jgi:uncharacterized phage protein (TIGR01671 family)